MRYEIPSNSNPEKLNVVRVQANKNYGICDILHVSESGQQTRMENVLAAFQGRQFNDEGVMEHLANIFNEMFNPSEN